MPIDFEAKSKQVHGDKYDYSKSEYINSNTKVQDRDILKNKLCTVNGIKIEYINYYDDVEKRLNEIVSE